MHCKILKYEKKLNDITSKLSVSRFLFVMQKKRIVCFPIDDITKLRTLTPAVHSRLASSRFIYNRCGGETTLIMASTRPKEYGLEEIARPRVSTREEQTCVHVRIKSLWSDDDDCEFSRVFFFILLLLNKTVQKHSTKQHQRYFFVFLFMRLKMKRVAAGGQIRRNFN